MASDRDAEGLEQAPESEKAQDSAPELSLASDPSTGMVLRYFRFYTRYVRSQQVGKRPLPSTAYHSRVLRLDPVMCAYCAMDGTRSAGPWLRQNGCGRGGDPWICYCVAHQLTQSGSVVTLGQSNLAISGRVRESFVRSSPERSDGALDTDCPPQGRTEKWGSQTQAG